MPRKINSKQKGARFERKLASIFRDYGDDTCRTAKVIGIELVTKGEANEAD